MKPNKDQTVKDIAQGIMDYLKSHKASGLVFEIIKQLKVLSAESARTARVETAINLNGMEKERIAGMLAKKYHWKEEIEYLVNPQLLGGIKITIGDKVLDLSVKTKLEDIYEQI